MRLLHAGLHEVSQYRDRVVIRRIDSGCGALSVHEDNGVIHARGVPYATAERFAAPGALAPSAGVIDATQRGPACPQVPSRLEFVAGPLIDGLAMSEHCQVLSVTAPADTAGLPVMVWFHGGAYVSGSGEAAKYDPDALVSEGRVVVVSVSYRLGIFGYLNLHDRDVENLGLRDQICALRWIRANIAAFGGDPARVTIFGQSAGGDSVRALLVCPDARGLFSRAILQSTPLGLPDYRAAMRAAMREAATATLAGTPPAEAGTDRMLEAQIAAVTAAQGFGLLSLMPFAPIQDCAPLPPRSELDRQFADAASRIEILVGYTRDDAAPFVAMDPRRRSLGRLGPVGRALAGAIGQRMTARVFGRPAEEFADAWIAAGGHAATYRVDWSPPQGRLGACHCIELPLLFGSPECWSDAPMLGAQRDAIDEELARRTRRYWSGFARDGIAALGPTPVVIG